MPPARRPCRPTRPFLGLEALEDRTQPSTLTLTLANSTLVEGGPPTTGTLTRTGDLSQALSVALASSDLTEATVPSPVVIPAGSATATLPVTPVDDTIPDGDQPVTLTATATTGPLTVGLDSTFGTGGLANTPLSGGSSLNPGDVLVLPDGKIVAAGSTDTLNGWAVDWLNPNGTTVITAYTSFPGTSGPAVPHAVALQPDGKVLVAGEVNGNGVTDWGVARYNADGTLDVTFGSGGQSVYVFPGYNSAYALAVRPDGHILVGGVGASGFDVGELSPDGTLLGTHSINFGLQGPPYFPGAYDMAVGPDGSVVLAGRIYGMGVFAVARFTPGLAPDTSFGPNGYQTLPASAFGSDYVKAEAYAVSVLSDGRILVGGTVWKNGASSGSQVGDFAAARFNPDGTLDTSFASDGTATIDLDDHSFGSSGDDGALAMAVQPDGKVVLGGYAWRPQQGSNQALARLNADGTPDTSFNGTGWFVAPPHPSTFEQIDAIALQPDGRLVAEAGYSTTHWVARFDMATGEVLTATASLTVVDNEPPPPTLTLTVSPTTFSEAAGAAAATGTVTRTNLPLNVDLVVTLSSNDTTEASVPASVTIPAGQASATFPVAAVDDTVPDGPQAVQITASASGLSAAAGVTVTDDDPAVPALGVTIDRLGVLEQTGPNAATGTVTRYNLPLDQPLVVTLISSETTEATVPASVTIPVGQASVTFPIATVDDTFVDGTHTVTITARANAPGLSGPITYDTSWGSGGWVNGFVNGRVAIAPDGKMVVAGTVGTVGSNADFGIYRYNANGTADTTFGPQASGYVQLNPVGPSDQPSAVLVQPDGKIIVAGFGTTSTTQSGEMVIVRLRANGTLDGFEFGTGGVVRLTFGAGVFNNLMDVALQPDGKIVLSGNIGLDFALVRLNPDGSLDTTFDGDGIVRTTLSTTGARAYAVAVAPDGKIVAVGSDAEGTGAGQRLIVARYNANGSPDTSFGTGGVVGTTFAAYDERATDVAVQSDGKVVVAATLGNISTGANDFAAIRYNADGSLDGGFGTGGMVTEAAASASGSPTRVILQTDGRIVVAGTAGTYQAGTLRGRFLRLTPAGVVETRTDSAWSYSATQAVAQDTIGNLYLAYNYGSSGSSGYVDRYKTLGPTISGTATLNVLDNEPFAAVADTYSTTEETTLTVSAAAGVRANDVVTAPINVQAELVVGPARGTLTFNADGSFTYVPAANFFGTDGFTYRLRDGIGVTSAVAVLINVANVNDAPVAVNNAYTTAEDTTLSVTAAAAQTSLSMVSDPGDWIGQGLTYNLSPASGNFTASGNATYLTINYQNPNNVSDYWSLTFRSPFDNVPLTPGTYLNVERAAFRTLGKPGLDVTGQHRGSNTVTGQFTILQIESSPTGQITRFAADFEQHSEGSVPALRGSIRFNYTPGAGPGVLSNDSDPDRDPLQVVFVSGPSHGQLSLNPDGTFSYTPALNYNGPDSFQYQATDGALLSNVATVSLTVTAVDDPPVTANDSATTAEDTAVTIPVLANDTDVEGDALRPTIVTQPAHGTVSVNAANQVVYVPAANFNGTDTFTYKATEIATGLSGNVATVTVTVTPVQDPPVARPDSYTTDQGVTLTVGAPGVLYNDSDPDGDPLTAALVSAPANGALTFNPDGSFTYAPDPAFFGTDTFVYAANDGQGNSAQATVTLTVLRTNDPPVAADDSATTNEDTIVGINVLANDSDPNGDPLTPVVYTQPAHGTAAYSANDGRIYYTPAANFNGTDSFTYRAYDGRAYSAPATVTVTVNPVNDPPVARNDAYDTSEDAILTIGPPGVLSNDTDVEGDPITAVFGSGPAHGTLTFNPDGSFTYVPNPNFNGVDSFTYRASDGQALSTPATVSITVVAVNDPPVGNPDFLSTNEDTPLAILRSTLLANDTDPDGNTLSITALTQPLHGTLSEAQTFNGYVYRPALNFNGTDTFTYRPFDGLVPGNVTTVTITVAAVNDAPVGTPDSYTTAEDTTLTVPAAGVLANDTDAEGDPITAVLATGPANGTLALNPNGSFTYTPRADYFGTDTFTYRPSDGQLQGNPTTVTITVTPVNDAPVAVPDSYTVAEDTTLSVAAGGSALDQQALGGGYVFNAGITNTNWQQGVKAGVTGVLASFDLFIYSGTPGVSFDVYVNKGAPWQADTPEFVTRLTVTSAMVGNWVTIDTSAANVALSAGEDFTIGTRNGSGADTFLLGAQDANGTNYVAGRVWYNGDPFPVGATGSYDLKFRTRMKAPGGVLANDTDADGDALSAVLVSGPAHGTLSLAANGGFTYVPAADYNGPDSFTYKANDGTADSNVTTVSLTVTPVNDPPTAMNDAATTNEDTAVTVAVLANDSDVENDPLTVTAVTQGANGSVTFTPGGVTYTPAADYFGSDSFTYTVSDGNGGTATATVNVTVNPVNDPPTLAPIADLTIPEDAGVQTVALSGITAGPPNEVQTLTVTATSDTPGLIPNPAVAYTSPNTTGILTFTPVADAYGSATITVSVSDGGLTTTRQFTVTVTPVNDPPTLAALPDVSILEDAGVQMVSLFGITAGPNESQTLTVTATSSNPGLIPNPAVAYTSPNATGSIAFAPLANANGTAVITVTVSDGALTTSRQFTVTVTAVNDAPSFTPGANQTVTAGTGPKTVGGWATNLSPGPADEAGQGLAFVVTTTNPGLFVALPAIDPTTGTLTFIPEASASGTATVTVVLRDTGGTANGGIDASTPQTFTITVNPNGLPTTPGVRMMGTELVITGAGTADTVSVSPQGNKVKVVATLNGTNFNQTFSGVTRVRVDTKGGNDTITFASNLTLPTWTDAGAGNDTVTGGGGADEIYLGDGDDTADAGAGNDFVAGGAGKDLIQGGTGNDTLYGGDGDDLVIGGPGVDQLFGQGGNDILVGGSAAVRSPSTDSLRKVLTDWNPASTGVGGYADVRARLQVTDDGSGDRLRGDAGTDWFWALTPPDAIDDLEPGEQQN
jgi:uncharacterized delta-60 repeat protein